MSAALSGQHEAGWYQKGLFQRSLPGGRLGGGWEATGERQPPFNTPISPTVILALTRIPALTPSFLRRQEPGDLRPQCAPQHPDSPPKPLPLRRHWRRNRAAAARGEFLPAQE